MNLPRAILFDHDGVLVASEPLHWEAWERMLAEQRIPYDPALIRSMVGKTAPEILRAQLDRFLPGWTPESYEIDALCLRKNDIYLELSKTRLQAYPGAEELIQWARSHGIRTAVVSNAKRRELAAALERLGLLPLFDTVISRDEIQPPKPDPAPYLFGARSVGTPPGDCLAVEDSPPGLEAALRAGMPTAAVLTNFTRERLEAPVAGHPELRPAWIGASLKELHLWLKGLEPPARSGAADPQ